MRVALKPPALSALQIVEQTMTADYTIERDRTALLFVDPYNDFLAEGGKLWPLVAEVAKANDLLGNLRSISSAAHNAGLQTVIVPHHRADPSDFEHWDHPTPYQLGAPFNYPQLIERVA
jgi:nicotinamidase-related amidase